MPNLDGDVDEWVFDPVQLGLGAIMREDEDAVVVLRRAVLRLREELADVLVELPVCELALLAAVLSQGVSEVRRGVAYACRRTLTDLQPAQFFVPMSVHDGQRDDSIVAMVMEWKVVVRSRVAEKWSLNTEIAGSAAGRMQTNGAEERHSGVSHLRRLI